MAIFTDGPLLEPDNKDIGEFHVGLGARLGATAARTWEDAPLHQLAGLHELGEAEHPIDFGEIASGLPTGPQLADAARPAASRIDIIDANDRVKKAGLAPHLKLPDQPDIAPAQLAIMMDRARRRHELDTTIERGPQGFIPGALDVGTSFLVGAVDPLNLASAFVPVMGELRYGKLLADAGASAVSRASVRAGVGAAQGVAGQALLEPLDWYSHTSDGRDFGMADVLHNLMFGAVLGGGLQAGGGAIADVYRSRKGRPRYPYGPGEPLEGSPQRVPLGPEMAPEAPPLSAAEPAFDTARTTVDINGERTVIDTGLAAARDAELNRGAPSAEVQTINDLPARAHEDAMRGALSDLINGNPVRSGEMLEAAAQSDPRIAESFNAHVRNAEVSASGARAVVAGDVRQKLLDAGMSEDEAAANAAIVAARYATRAERLGGAENAVELYRGENISIGQGEGSPEGRAFHQLQPQAPAFYSAVDRAVTSAKQDKASPEQWLGTLKNAAGVKAEEMKWLGLEDWLNDQQGPVSKGQLQDYVRANAIKVKEVNKGGIVKKVSAADRDRMAVSLYAKKWNDLRPFEQDLVANYLNPPQPLTKFSSYTLPGGENYREMLLTLPEREHPAVTEAYAINEKLLEKYGSLTEAFQRWTEDEREEFDRIHGTAHKAPVPAKFTSSHWEEPNVLAHIRFDDRISDGKKTLHVAEVQSDWHQAGKRKGYQSEIIPAAERATLEAEHQRLAAEAVDIEMRRADEASAQSLKGQDYSDYRYGDPGWIAKMDRITEINEKLGQHTGRVPDAPFKTTWPELSMKRMIRYAAEHGYDRISWDTGATNAERYDLSKYVKEIQYVKNADGSYRLGIADKDGEPVGALPGMDVNKMTLDQVEHALGKEVAEKIKNEEGRKFRGHDTGSGAKLSGMVLENVDLKVGGEGMAGFYDRILPATVNRLVKKFGAKVEETAIAADKEGWHITPPDQTTSGKWMVKSSDYNSKGLQFDTEAAAREALVERIGSAPVHSLDITPELRQAALEHGFPLFQGGADSPRGRITLSDNKAIIDLYKSADASTFMHESGHLWLDELMRDAARAEAPHGLKADRDTVLAWLGVKDASEIATAQHERWAEGFEQYLKTGEAPSGALAKAFAQFKQWLGEIYRALARTGQEISPEIKAVMDRMLASEAEIADRADELGASTRAVSKSKPAGRAGADPQTWSLFEFLSHEGGLKPDPELKAIFGSERGPFVRGFGSLIRKGGLDLDEALSRAKEQHYMADPHDAANGEAGSGGRTSLGLIPRDLLDLIDKENRRDRQYRLDRAAPDETVDRVEEARHIVAALHDDLEAGGGAHALEIDPKLESRVVEIVQKEGGTDVLAAYERAIMEDAERYEGVANARRQDESTRHLPGWDAAEPGAAPQPGAADRGGGRPAGVSADGRGAADGGASRTSGAGDRASPATQLDRDAAWRTLSRITPDFDAPEIVAASKAADEVPKPPSKLADRVTASEKADAFAKQMYDMFAHRLPEQDRVRLDDLIKRIDDDHEAREIAIVRGGSCLFGVV